MKNNKAAELLKRIIAALREMAKAKTLALKTKTNALRTRLIILSLLRNKKLLITSNFQKLRSLINPGRQHHDKEIEQQEGEEEHQINITPAGDHHDDHALVHYNQNTSCKCTDTSTAANLNMVESSFYIGEDLEEGIYGADDDDHDDDDKYPDLTHSLFESDEGGGGSVIDMVKNCKEEKGEEFCLEDEIDLVADLFIRRFHHQIRIEKQLSLNRRRHHHQHHMLLPEPAHA